MIVCMPFISFSLNIQTKRCNADDHQKLGNSAPENALDIYKELILVAKDDDKIMETAIYKTGTCVRSPGYHV